MRARILVLAVVLLGSASLSWGDQAAAWPRWSWLIGEWVGEGSGQPGQGRGWFSLQPDLDGKILLRKNHSEYPATKDKPRIVHDDLMVVYGDEAAQPGKAIYFDNEGHTIEYAASLGDDLIVLTSARVPNAPIFRLTYGRIDKDSITVKFEMSQDGQTFKVYTVGTSRRKKK